MSEVQDFLAHWDDSVQRLGASPDHCFTVSQFVDDCNTTLRTNYQQIYVTGEVASFKINQNKWVFFDLKDQETSINCFLPVFKLRTALTDGMKIIVCGTPKLTPWGRFSFTIEQIRPVGEGSIKKSFELLKRKLTAEGLFDPAKKRPLPTPLEHIGVISSTQAAGYADFIKILNERWGGLKVQVAHTQVQGLDAPDQIIRALQYFNQRAEVQVIAILRGGGSADDLATFNDEQLVRTIASSRLPIITGIGHEVDQSLADLAADVQASTPSNAAQLLTPDRHAIMLRTRDRVRQIRSLTLERISHLSTSNHDRLIQARQQIMTQLNTIVQHIRHQQQLLESLNPESTLKRGYAIITGKTTPGNVVKITTAKQLIKAEVQDVQKRS